MYKQNDLEVGEWNKVGPAAAGPEYHHPHPQPGSSAYAGTLSEREASLERVLSESEKQCATLRKENEWHKEHTFNLQAHITELKALNAKMQSAKEHAEDRASDAEGRLLEACNTSGNMAALENQLKELKIRHQNEKVKTMELRAVNGALLGIIEGALNR